MRKKFLPEFIDIDFFQDESDKIKSQINDLENNVILASLIVLLIIVIFMGWKSGPFSKYFYTNIIFMFNDNTFVF